jgi:hypothetical protein
MSAAGNCCDNAAMEAFWSTLKTEAIHGNFFRTREEARLALFDDIETLYHRKRRHSALDFKSPVDFENQFTYNRNQLVCDRPFFRGKSTPRFWHIMRLSENGKKSPDEDKRVCSMVESKPLDPEL